MYCPFFFFTLAISYLLRLACSRLTHFAIFMGAVVCGFQVHTFQQVTNPRLVYYDQLIHWKTSYSTVLQAVEPVLFGVVHSVRS